MASYTLGFRCEDCGGLRSDTSQRWCAGCRGSNSQGAINSVEAATSPWWRDADGTLARVRGDAAVVREIIRGQSTAAAGEAHRYRCDNASIPTAPGD
jgi:hypothetical protein